MFAGMAAGWDDVCGGGVWWTRKKTYKNAIPNELFLLIAGRLHQRTTPAAGYLDWALREWHWFLGSGMIGAAGLVNDGLTADCANNGRHDLDLQPGGDRRWARGPAGHHRRQRLPARRGHRGGRAARPDRTAGHPGRAGQAAAPGPLITTTRS